jgi:hypothetical protein
MRAISIVSELLSIRLGTCITAVYKTSRDNRFCVVVFTSIKVRKRELHDGRIDNVYRDFFRIGFLRPCELCYI